MNDEKLTEAETSMKRLYRRASALDVERADGYVPNHAVIGRAAADARAVFGLDTEYLGGVTKDFTASAIAVLDDERTLSRATVGGLKSSHDSAALKSMLAELLGIENITSLGKCLYRTLAAAEMKTGKTVDVLAEENDVRDGHTFYAEVRALMEEEDGDESDD